MLKKTPLWLWILGTLGGAFFFWRAPALWPLVAVDLHAPPARIEKLARERAASLGLDTAGFGARVVFEPDESLIDALDASLGRQEAQALLAGGAPAVRYAVELTRAGDPHRHRIDLHPSGKIVFFQRGLEDDDPAIPDREASEPDARKSLARILDISLDGWKTISAATREQPNRVERSFVFERLLPESPAFRERAAVTLVGGTVVRAVRNLVPPPSILRASRKRAALGDSLETLGLLLFAPAVLGGGAVFLLRLRAGTARLRAPALLAGGSFALLLAANALRKTLGDDPLVPDALEFVRRLAGVVAQFGWTFALLFAVISAGDSLDREGGFGKGATLRAWATGRWRAPGVGASARNGFLLGLLCGGVMAALVGALEIAVGARAALQPRHFALFMLNTACPPLASLAYFIQIALLEELGYRYFAGTWLFGLTRRKWLAIGLPAIVYGLTHTTLGFLPPAEPFWARALVMAVVGAVWGGAFFRFDALTVVLSHLTADLFIFNWPGIARGDTLSVAVVLIPLLPAFLASLPGPPFGTPPNPLSVYFRLRRDERGSPRGGAPLPSPRRSRNQAEGRGRGMGAEAESYASGSAPSAGASATAAADEGDAPE